MRLDPDRVVELDADGRSDAAFSARRPHDVSITMRQQQEVACLEQQVLSVTLLEKAASLGHNMKLRPAEPLRFMLRLPSCRELADFLDFPAHHEQGRDGG